VSINISQLPRRLFVGLFLLGSLVLSLSLLQGIKELLAIENQVRLAEQTAKDLAIEKENLKRELAGVSSTDYQETEIRDNLLMAKPNETVVILPELSQVAPRTTTTNETQVDVGGVMLPIWRRWVDVFF
jgi:cell division protein FtsB